MNPLTKAAYERVNYKRNKRIDYLLVIVAGIVLGTMFGLGV